MNRQTPQRTQPPSGYRQTAPSNPNPMYYATAGAQTTTSQQPSRPTGTQGQLPAGFPSGGIASRAPPGFSARPAGDTSEFPALGGGSSYASQAQQSGMFASQPQPPAGLQASGPPPGISAPGAGASGQGQSNGPRDGDREQEFPALGGMGGDKDRIPNFLRNHGQHVQSPSSPPPTLSNGASGSQNMTSTAATSIVTPRTHQPQHHMAADASWLDNQSQSPSRGISQITRPVEQLLSSPADAWGLQALLHDIRMATGDRAMLIHGEDLTQMGIMLHQSAPLFPSFVTPWLNASQVAMAGTAEEPYDIPSYYLVTPPPIATKMADFEEDTLFYIFYTCPQDMSQLQVADELYNRGWRYHMPTQMWIQGPELHHFNPRDAPPTEDTPMIRGLVIAFDPHKFERLPPQEHTINPFDIEATQRPPLQDDKKASIKDVKSPDSHHAGLTSASASVLSSR